MFVCECVHTCVCVSVDIALKLLLYRTSTEKHNETVRQTAGVGYCCCLLCMRMKSAAFDIDYRNTLCAWIYVHLYLNIHTCIHTYGMHVCNLSLLCGCFLYLCNCSLLSFSPIYCNCVVARSRVEKAVSLLIIHMCMYACRQTHVYVHIYVETNVTMCSCTVLLFYCCTPSMMYIHTYIHNMHTLAHNLLRHIVTKVSIEFSKCFVLQRPHLHSHWYSHTHTHRMYLYR